jgi:TetR/AcrR family transcriptional regulator
VNIRTKHLPAEERRAATVEAVIELAAGHDPGEITTTAIAQHMNVTQGALFKHFPTKDAILAAVMTWVADRLLNRVDRAAQAAESTSGRRTRGDVHEPTSNSLPSTPACPG